MNRSSISARGATVKPANGGAPVFLDLPRHEHVRAVLRYRGGYLAAVSLRREYRERAVVFDAQGQLVRRLHDCIHGPVSSTDGDLVAWISYPCGDRHHLTLRVGPRDDLTAPDREQRLSMWDDYVGYPAAWLAYPTTVGEWGVAIQIVDMKGYLQDSFVALPATGEVRRVPRTYEVTSVSPQGIACCVQRPLSLIDLRTNAVGRPSPMITAWSSDGSEALVAPRHERDPYVVVDSRTGKVLRRVSLPPKVSVREARWEDADTLLFKVSRYDPAYVEYSTILRVTASGAIERVTGVSDSAVHSFF